jgi:hypothetical protein
VIADGSGKAPTAGDPAIDRLSDRDRLIHCVTREWSVGLMGRDSDGQLYPVAGPIGRPGYGRG